MPRLIAIGDIHGCTRELDALLALVRPQPQDQLIFLGDYVDRGPDTPGVIDRLIRLRESFENLVTLRGNHDEWFMDARNGRARGWLSVGGLATLKAYAPKIVRDLGSDQSAASASPNSATLARRALDRVPDAHWQFMEDCVLYHRQGGHIFVHAGLDPFKPLEEQSTHALLMGTPLLLGPPGYRGSETVVFGHKDTRKLRSDGRLLPYQPNDINVIGLDTQAHATGVLTAMDVNTGQVWQTRKQSSG
jgi:serine/threonine protein phosphatase 1